MGVKMRCNKCNLKEEFCDCEKADAPKGRVDNIVILPIAKFEKIGGKYIVWDDNPGWQEALYNSKYDTWKSTDRPLKNACGQQVIRQILYPEYFAVIPDTI